MKYCINCGMQMNDEQIFCSNCGYRNELVPQMQTPVVAEEEKSAEQHVEHQPEQPQVQEREEVHKKEKKPRKKLWLVIVAIILALGILAAGVLWLLYYFSPEQRIIRLLNDNKIEEAYELFDSQNIDDTDALVKYIRTRLDLLISEFGAGSRTHDDTVAELEAYQAMELEEIQGEVSNAFVTVSQIQVSKEDYATAEKQEADQDYALAIKYYSLVSKLDTQNYAAAQNKLADCTDAYRQFVLGEAKKYADKGLIDDAIAKLDEGLALLAEDKMLLETRNGYVAENRTQLLATAQKYVSEGNYIEGLNTLKKHRSDTEVDSAYKAYFAEYVALIEKNAKAAMEQGGYTEASKIINEALQSFPDAKELQALWDSYEQYAPVYISSCSIMEDAADGLSKNKYTTDKYENKYSTSFSVDEGSVTFLAANKYKSFTGVVSCPYEIKEAASSKARITIYTDNSIAFTSDWFTMTTAPQNFKIDLTGVQTVKISWEYDWGSSWGTANGGHRATIFDGAFNTY